MPGEEEERRRAPHSATGNFNNPSQEIFPCVLNARYFQQKVSRDLTPGNTSKFNLDNFYIKQYFLVFDVLHCQLEEDVDRNDEFYDEQPQFGHQQYYMEPAADTRGKHDMNFVLGGQGIENEPFIDLSPIELPHCDETYMRLMSMKQERSKMLSDHQNTMFGMKPGDGSNISV